MRVFPSQSTKVTLIAKLNLFCVLFFMTIASPLANSAPKKNPDQSFDNVSRENYNGDGLNREGSITHNFSLRRSSLIETDFKEAVLTDFDFNDVDLSRADFRGCRVSNSSIHNCKFAKARLEGARIVDSDFTANSFRDAKLDSTIFIRTNLHGCDFRGAHLHDALFILSNLSGALFNKSTQLPFSSETALKRGMIFESN